MVDWNKDLPELAYREALKKNIFSVLINSLNKEINGAGELNNLQEETQRDRWIVKVNFKKFEVWLYRDKIDYDRGANMAYNKHNINRQLVFYVSLVSKDFGDYMLFAPKSPEGAHLILVMKYDKSYFENVIKEVNIWALNLFRTYKSKFLEQ